MSFYVQLYSVEQLQHMHAAVQQQLMGGMTIRPRGSVGSLEGGRIFNDAIAWISQQKVRSSFLTEFKCLVAENDWCEFIQNILRTDCGLIFQTISKGSQGLSVTTLIMGGNANAFLLNIQESSNKSGNTTLTKLVMVR